MAADCDRCAAIADKGMNVQQFHDESRRLFDARESVAIGDSNSICLECGKTFSKRHDLSSRCLTCERDILLNALTRISDISGTLKEIADMAIAKTGYSDPRTAKGN